MIGERYDMNALGEEAMKIFMENDFSIQTPGISTFTNAPTLVQPVGDCNLEEEPKEMNETCKSITDVKTKLDVLINIFSNEVDSPQLQFIKDSLSCELMEMNSTLDSIISQANSAVNTQQAINTSNLDVNSGMSTPVVISIPMGTLNAQ